MSDPLLYEWDELFDDSDFPGGSNGVFPCGRSYNSQNPVDCGR